MAFGLSILLFIIFTTVGLVVLTTLYRQNNALQDVLLAPAVGSATLVLPVYWLNSIGIPVGKFGIALALLVLVSITVSIWRFRPKFPWRSYLPFAVILFTALLITGRPLLEFGFEWVSYGNHDMTSLYSLAAQRFLEYGYYAPPNADYLEGRDYTQAIRSLYTDNGLRSGAELLLAWLLSLTGLNPHQAYMPLGITMLLTLISASGGMIYQKEELHLPALLTMILLSMSALTSLPSLYQLNPQVIGVATLVACSALLLRPLSNLKRWEIIRRGIAIGIVFAGLLLFYNEVSPFLILGFFVCLVINFAKQQFDIRAYFPLIAAIVITLLTLHVYLLGRFAHFLIVLPQGSTHDLIPVFPYFLIPNGLAHLWGFVSIVGQTSEPVQSIMIALGGLLLVLTIIGALSLLKTGYPAPIITTIMLGAAAALFLSESAYGLFKLALVIQPFMVGTLVLFWFSLFKQRALQILPLLLIGALGLPTQFSYVEASRNLLDNSGLSEIPFASTSRINTEFKNLVTSAQADHLIIDTSNISLAWLQAFYTRGKVASFPVLNNFVYPKFLESTLKNTYIDYSDHVFSTQVFDLVGGINPSDKNEFVSYGPKFEIPTNSKNTVLVTPTHRQGILNRRKFDPESTNNFISQPLAQVKDHLVFIPSKLGPHYFSFANAASFYQMEPDIFYPQRTMAAFGQYFLLRAINPSEKVRLVLDLTDSLQSDGENKLPPAMAIGTEREFFPLKGRGAARVFSPPLSPQMIDGLPYLGIDMGVEPISFVGRRSGLMQLYGQDVPLGRKRLVAFGRDISLISEDEYANINSPTQIATFPDDFTNPELEYSGVYEDGWISEAAFLKLRQPNVSSKLTIHGIVPEIHDSAFTSTLEVMVDGKKVVSQRLELGEFKVQLEVPFEKKNRRIDLLFSNFQHLPSPDSRPVAAQLKFIGFADENS
jgi:hypothetical protein